MAVVLQGNLRHFPLRQLLPLLGSHRHSGTLECDAKGNRARIVFRAGVVVYGTSKSETDVPAVVASLLEEQEATFTFLDTVELPDNAAEVKFEVDALLREAERRARAYADDTRFKVIETPAAPQEISIKPEQFKLLFRIGGGRTFGELMADSGATRDNLSRSLRELETAGLISREGAGAGAGAETPPEPPKAPAAKKLAGALTANPPQPAAVHPLIADAYVIGRDSKCDIVLANPSISSKHARIARTAESFSIEDLGSRNGTFVNGEPVKESVNLADNDTLRFGKLMFTFNLASEAPSISTTQRKLVRS